MGVSNVSFGLPARDGINSVFFALAMENGLSAAIMNPYSADMMRTYYAFKALKGMDENCGEYISHSAEFLSSFQPASQSVTAITGTSPLMDAVIKGLKEKAVETTKELLASKAPLDIVNEDIIPALNKVGEGFEKNIIFLPQLLTSAEAAKCAFEQIKAVSAKESGNAKGKFILATVHGDIHDIGKNIVKVLLENYGYDVIDLGKDVTPQTIVDAVKTHNVKLVGLSALMTTTVPAMEETIRLLKEQTTDVCVMVGGAVLTEEYAEMIGADYYGKDAMSSVRIAEKFFAD